MRETAFRLARRDLAQFLIDHEDRLMVIFRDELRKLDEEIPEENLFIDIHLVPLGEMILKAVLRALNRFLLMDDDANAMKGVQSEHTSTV
jgi:hypothetical protein